MTDVKKIRLCYRKVIDATAATPWDQYVLEDTYAEFCLQAQLYDGEGKIHLFSSLLQAFPAAEKLHYLVSTAVVGYLRGLNGLVPDVRNNLGQLFLKFENFRFELIESDRSDKRKHRVAITFYTDYLQWHGTIGDQLLLSPSTPSEGGEVLTDLVALQPFLSIYSLIQNPSDAG